MQTSAEIKEVVREKYGQIAETKLNGNCGCGSCNGDADVELLNDDYTKLAGYAPDADLGLGCGLPTEFAQIKEGDTVLDLGSGAGNDVFVARAVVGEKGRVIGVDMTEKMIAKAKENAEKLGYDNVEFRLGEIEDLPIPNDSVDVVVSNCVMNLVPDKQKAFAETFRVIKRGGHFSISDIVTFGEMPERVKNDLSLYVGCVSGAQSKEDYLKTIRDAGFKGVTVQKERKVNVGEGELSLHLTPEEIEQYKKGEFGIASVTVYAEKPCC